MYGRHVQEQKNTRDLIPRGVYSYTCSVYQPVPTMFLINFEPYRLLRPAHVFGFGVLALVLAGSGAQAEVRVPVVPVKVQSVGSVFELEGVVQAVQQSTVSAQTSGRLIAVGVKAGDRVKAAQVLATVDDRETQTGLQRSQAQTAQARAELRTAQLNFERTRALNQQGFVSSAALDVADAQLKSAQAGRDQASVGEKQAGLSQGFTRVTAPFDGWVMQVHAEVGDLAMPGKPLLTLYAPGLLRVAVQVPVSRAKQVPSGSAIEVWAAAPNGTSRWVTSSVVAKLPAVDPVSQTVEWRLSLPSEASAAGVPGQAMKVRFASGQSQRLMVPGAAVLRRGELTAVYVTAKQGFALKAIRLGADHGAQGVEVLAGLLASDRVALDPIQAGLLGAQAQPTVK